MKKRIAMALGLIFVMLMLGACGTDPVDVDYNGYSYSELATVTINTVDLLNQYCTSEEDWESLASYNTDAGIRWLELKDEEGRYLGTVDESFSISKAGNTLTTNIRLRFEKRDVDFQIVYTYYNMKISGITMEPVYSMSEKLGKAGINTLISVLIVFSVLVLISLIIAGFQIFPYLEKRSAEKKAAIQATEVHAAPDESRIEPVEEPQAVDNTELVAVIAAAIAAATGSSTSDFVVRSINRRK